MRVPSWGCRTLKNVLPHAGGVENDAGPGNADASAWDAWIVEPLPALELKVTKASSVTRLGSTGKSRRWPPSLSLQALGSLGVLVVITSLRSSSRGGSGATQAECQCCPSEGIESLSSMVSCSRVEDFFSMSLQSSKFCSLGGGGYLGAEGALPGCLLSSRTPKPG